MATQKSSSENGAERSPSETLFELSRLGKTSEFIGEWIVVTSDGIVANDKSLRKAVMTARRKIGRVPYVTDFVPYDNSIYAHNEVKS